MKMFLRILNCKFSFRFCIYMPYLPKFVPKNGFAVRIAAFFYCIDGISVVR